MDSIMNEVKTETTTNFIMGKNFKKLGMMTLLNRPSIINGFPLSSAHERIQ